MFEIWEIADEVATHQPSIPQNRNQVKAVQSIPLRQDADLVTLHYWKYEVDTPDELTTPPWMVTNKRFTTTSRPAPTWIVPAIVGPPLYPPAGRRRT